MKKQLLFNFTKNLFRKTSFRMAAFAVLTLLTAQSSFSQVSYSWTGGASTLEMTTLGNWASGGVSPTAITSSDNYSVITASGTVTNTAAFTCRTLFINKGITVDANANLSANTNNTSTVNGTLNIKVGTCNIQKLYVGGTANAGITGVVNVEAGATLTGAGNVWRVGANTAATGTININGGTMNLLTTGNLSVGQTYTGVINLLNSGTTTIASTASCGLTSNGTVNVAGGTWNHGPVNISNDGTINVTNGSFKLSNAAATINNSTTAATTATTGVININGATAKLEASGTLAIGNSFAGSTGLVTVNVTSGTMNVGGALTISQPSGVYTGLINIDAGSIVLTGNQTAGIAALITASRIKTSGAALADGKIISNTYDAGTGKTTVIAVAASSNTAPVANNDAIIVAPGGTATALVGGTATSVLTNDTDGEGNALTAIVVTNPTYGTLTLNPNGTFSYVQNIGSSATDSFTYKANDGTSDSNTATVTITITSVNNAPVANNDAFSVKQGGTVVTAGATSVLTNDTDAEGNPLTATVVTGPANGTLTLNANGTFSYLHNNSATATDSFTYKANDGTSDSNEATVNITVTAPVTTTNTWTGGTSTDFLAASNWTASDAPNPAVFSTLASFTVPATANSPVLNANYSTVSGAASCVALTVSSGAVLTANANIATSSTTTTSLVNGTLHINAGATCNLLRLYTGNTTGTTATINVNTGGTLSGNSYWRVGSVASCPGIFNINGGTLVYSGASTGVVLGYAATGSINLNSGTATINGIFDINATGTLNVAGGVWNHGTATIKNAGTMSITGGAFKFLNAAVTINPDSASTTGVINIGAGGTLETAAGSSLTIGSTTTGAFNVNVNGGTVNVNGTLSVLPTATVNIDAGSIVLAGDQTVAINSLVGANRIITSGAAASAGKIISNTYNAGTDKTTVVAVDATTTWNGSAWSNGTPTASVEAIIDGTYNGAAFDAKKLTINSGKSLTVTTGNMTIQNEVINNGTMVVENNANLIQVNNTTNTGAITVNRNSSPLLRLDYTLWSSPVAGQNLAAFSPLTSQSPNRFYTYDTATNLYTNAFDPTATNFAAATGYLIRMPNTADASTPTAYAGQFTGVPNNGDVPFTLSTAGGGYNLVGNPYPSPISAATLVANNSGVIDTNMYFWRKTNGVGTAYCTYNTAGSVFTSNGNTQSVNPAGIIQTGQGFFVKAIAPGALVFKNGQRAANTAGQFFKTKQVATADKVWLNATNAAGDFSQMAVNYTEGATPGVDAFDGKYINDSPLALTSNINNEEYTIQGRPAFDASDVVPLNFKTAVAGNYTIAIDHSEGVFATGQSVILVDATAGTETDLTTSAYTFTATTGTANSRFSLKYQKTLGTNQAVFSDNNVAVYRSKGTLYVNTGGVTIANIKVYDVQGRLIAELKNVKSTLASINNLKATNQVLVVKITSQENKVVTKKVVN